MSTVHPVPVLGPRNINAFVVLGDRPVLVDTGTPGSARRLCAALARLGLKPGDLGAIVLTHGHVDHFGAAAALRALSGAPVIGHRGDLAVYGSGHVRLPYLPTGPVGRMLARRRDLYEPVEPVELDVVADDEEVDLRPYGLAAMAVATPGHTAGSLSVVTEDGDALVGDMLAGALFGVLGRRPANPPFHDDPLTNLSSLDALLARRPTRLHVGHGAVLNPARVGRWARRERRRLDRLRNYGRLRVRDEAPIAS